jgi:uncharacterized membrane protein
VLGALYVVFNLAKCQRLIVDCNTSNHILIRYWDYKFNNISLLVAIVNLEHIAVAKQQVKTLGDVVKSYATMLAALREVTAVGHNTRKLITVDIYINMYERLLIVADAMLEGILNKYNEQKWWELNLAT